MLRSMSPDVIITDEIAGCDVEAIKQALSCGVRIIATAHGDNVWQVKNVWAAAVLWRNSACIILLGRRNGQAL